MLKLTIFLKSGQSIDVECEECSFTRGGDAFTSYEIKGLKYPEKISLLLSEIAGYTASKKVNRKVF